MEIRNEINNIINRNISNDSKPSPQNIILEKKVNHPQEGNPLDINEMRAKVGGLQKELNRLQTDLSQKQVQLALLDELKNDTNWQKKFSDAMKSYYGKEISFSGNSSEEFAGMIEKEAFQVQNKITENTIKQENLFASGKIEREASSISKDMDQSEAVFAQMNLENIQKLLNEDESR